MRDYHNAVSQKRRISFVIVLFVLIFSSILARMFYLQVVKHDYYYKLASMQHSSKDTIPAKRGKIYAYDTLSDTPYPLATNQSLDMVYIAPKEVKDKDQVANELAGVLGMDAKDILTMINNGSTYVPVKHKLTKEQSDAVKAKNLSGVGLSEESWRYYPEGPFASSVLGFVNAEGVGNYGLEESLNEQLTGLPGQYKADTDSSGVRIAFGNNVLKPAVDGGDVYLTVDRYVQKKAEDLLADTIKQFSAPSGSVIVMEPKTGKIIAMANAPSFDPNKFGEVKDYEQFKNRAITDTYEPGSIFKVITMAAGLDNGTITPDTKYEDTGSVILNGNKIMNSDKKAHGVCTMTYVLEQSLNTGTTWLEQHLGKDKFYQYIRKFNFGSLSGIDLPGEVAGYVNKPSQLNDHGYATMSFGQSISTTPIQMIDAFAAVANKGKIMRPYIVDHIVNSKGEKIETKPSEIGQVISEKAAADLTKMMVSVVENGHGKQAKVMGFKVAGKTGTAQVVGKNGGYLDGKNIGSFIGFAPSDDARFVVLAKVDEPQNVAWAESTAAPIVGSMLDFLTKYYQVPPTEKIQ